MCKYARVGIYRYRYIYLCVCVCVCVWSIGFSEYIYKYIYDKALLTNTPTQAESLVHTMDQVAGGIGLRLNTEKKSACILIKKHLYARFWFSEIRGQVHLPR